MPTHVEGLHAMPSTIDLAGAEIELVSQFSRENRLKKALEPVREGLTTSSCSTARRSLGLLTVNALTAAEELIVPIQCEYYALEGLGQLLRNVSLVQQNINPELRLSGIVMTMFDPRTKLSEQVVQEVRNYFGDLVYDVIIPRTVRLSEAPGFGQPITVYDPKSKGAEAYRELAREVALRPAPDEPMPIYDDLPTIVVSRSSRRCEPDRPDEDEPRGRAADPESSRRPRPGDRRSSRTPPRTNSRWWRSGGGHRGGRCATCTETEPGDPSTSRRRWRTSGSRRPCLASRPPSRAGRRRDRPASRRNDDLWEEADEPPTAPLARLSAPVPRPTRPPSRTTGRGHRRGRRLFGTPSSASAGSQDGRRRAHRRVADIGAQLEDDDERRNADGDCSAREASDVEARRARSRALGVDPERPGDAGWVAGAARGPGQRHLPEPEAAPDPLGRDEIASLAASIREVGILQPIVVRTAGAGTSWSRASAGCERPRWRASPRSRSSCATPTTPTSCARP